MVHDDDRQRVLTELSARITRAAHKHAGPPPIKPDRLEEWDEWEQELSQAVSDIMDAIVDNAVERLDNDK